MNSYSITRWLLDSRKKVTHMIPAASRKEALRASQELVDTVYKCESVVIGYRRVK